VGFLPDFQSWKSFTGWHRSISIAPLFDDLVIWAKASRRTDGNLCKAVWHLLTFVYHCFDRLVILGHIPLLTRPETSFISSATSTTAAPSPRKCCERGPTSITAGWKPSPENARSPSNGKKGRAQRRLRPRLLAAHGAPEWLRCLFHSEEHGGCTLLPVHGPAVPGGRSRLPHHRPPALPLYPLLLRHPRRGAGSPCAWVLSSLSRLPTTSTAITTSSENCSSARSPSGRTTMPSSPLLIPRLCKLPPIGSVQTSSVNAWTTGLGWWGRTLPKPTARRSN